MAYVRRRERLLIALALSGVLLLTFAYSGLAIFKAYQYTDTPRQDVAAITPPADGLPYQEVSFPSAADDGVELSGWWIPKPGSHRVLILVHGRYENRMAMLPLAKPLWDRGFNLLLFDLRGHGRSTHVPNTYGIKEQWDVVGAAQFARQKGYAPESIGVIGWSLGGAATLMSMGSSNGFVAAVADSAYANSAPLLARNPLAPGLALAMKLFREVDLAKVRPDDSIRGLSGRSIMLIHGAVDQAVPLSQERLLEQSGEGSVKQIWVVPGAGHVQAYTQHPDEYIQKVTAFFDAALH